MMRLQTCGVLILATTAKVAKGFQGFEDYGDYDAPYYSQDGGADSGPPSGPDYRVSGLKTL